MCWLTLSGTPSHCRGGGTVSSTSPRCCNCSAASGVQSRGAQDVFDEAGGRFSGSGSGVLFIDEVGEGQQFGFLVVDDDGKIAGAHEFVDNTVDGGKKLLEILRGAGLFSDAIESGAEAFGAFALGNVAIDGVEGNGLAVDDQRSGGDANIEQGAVFTAALGFESEGFAALEALGDPLRFGRAIGRKNQLVDGVAQGLSGGVAKHALELLVDALRAERGVRDDDRVG